MSDSTQAPAKQSFLEAMRSHPASVDETYFGHMRFALRFSGLLFAAGGAALVHAVLPAVFELTAGNMIRKMYAMIETRH